MRDRLTEGYRIGEAAALLGEGEAEPRTPVELRDALYDAARRADGDEIERLLDHTFAVQTIDGACADVVAPVLQRIGDGWESGELSVAQEHLVSEAVRARLEARLTYARGSVRGTAVLACAPGERHEIGLLMAATLLRSDGWQVAYLGADTPLADAADLAARIDADVLAFSVGMPEHVSALGGLGKPQRGDAARVVGGRAASAGVARSIGARYLGDDLVLAVEQLRWLRA